VIATFTRHPAHAAKASRASEGCCWQFHYHLFLYNLPTTSVPHNTARPPLCSATRDRPEILRGGNAQLSQESCSAVPFKGWDPVDLREPVNHHQLEEPKASNYCWPKLHQPHFLIAGFNFLIRLQQCSQCRDTQPKSPGQLRES